MLLSQQDRRRGNLTGLCGGGVQNRELYCVQATSVDPASSALKSKEGNLTSMQLSFIPNV